MSDRTVASTDEQKAGVTLNSYVTGFVISVLLTVTAYLLVTHRALNRSVLIAVIVVFALAQFIIQLVYFLHLGRETRPRWKLLVFGLMITVVLILVFGSLWIMSNLNYNMSPQQMQNYMQNQDGL